LDTRVRVLGVTGPVAGGKSSVSAALAERGAEILELDSIGHRLLAGDEVRKQVEEEFPEVQDCSSQEELRSRLGAIVFSDPRRLAALERILHPRMCDVVRERVEALRLEAEEGVLVISGALLFEMGLDEICDRVVTVDAPFEVRVRRASQSRGWTEQEIKRREARQLPAQVKRQRADCVIDNSGDHLELQARVGNIWEEFLCP